VNARERFVETLTFGRPDRVPFSPGGPRESTLAAWRTQGLPADAAWFPHLLRTLGIDSAPTGQRSAADVGVDFRMIPQFEERVLERRDGHLIVQDWKGNVCEIADTFDVTYLREAKDFVTRRWIRCPVETRDDWERMKERYRVDTAGRFAEDFADRCRRLKDRDVPLIVSFSGPFWQMREWCGFEPLCFLTLEQPDLVDEMAVFWSEFVAKLLERILEHVTPDMVHLSEDMAYKGHSMISPAMVRRFCMPAYRRWAGLARDAGSPLVGVDSDGCIDELAPLWIEAGLNVTDPVEVAAGNDLPALRREHGRRLAYRGGVDKRAMARGGEAIERELERLAPVIRDGGYLPSCDHGVPSDVSWPAYVDYSRRLARLTGWL
jgi:uroporphyrinogen decarboxylase